MRRENIDPSLIILRDSACKEFVWYVHPGGRKELFGLSSLARYLEISLSKLHASWIRYGCLDEFDSSMISRRKTGGVIGRGYVVDGKHFQTQLQVARYVGRDDSTIGRAFKLLGRDHATKEELLACRWPAKKQGDIEPVEEKKNRANTKPRSIDDVVYEPTAMERACLRFL